MPIDSIISQPTTNSINAAYRPIALSVRATKTNGDPVPPVVYCDIYLNDVYYKTISKTQYTTLNSGNSEWQFFIEDAVQEYCKKFIEDVGESSIIEAPLICVKTLCKFRSSGIDTEGFIQTEDTAPVQGTFNTDPVAGTGTSSNTFYSVNATLQHEDNQDLSQHLTSFKTGTWDSTTYPLSHRPNGYLLCVEDSDSFPILSDKVPTSLNIHFTRLDGTTDTDDYSTPCIPVAIAGTLPDATKDTAYSYSLTLTGTAPFSLSNIVKPSWMTIAIEDNKVVFSGTPTATATAVDVSFDINNCTSDTTSFADTIDVLASGPECVAANIVGGDPTIPDGQAGSAYSFSIVLDGTAPFSLDVVTKPSWLTIELDAFNNVNLTGTPPTNQIGVDQVVDFTISNACGTVRVFKTFYIKNPSRNVWVINDTDGPVYLKNSNGTYMYPTGGGGNFPMSDGVFTIQTMGGTWIVKALQSMPSTIVQDFGYCTQGQVLTDNYLSTTNYIWFNCPF